MIESEGKLVINIYCPNEKTERENFFLELTKIELPKNKLIFLTGDFNCVTNPIIDRSTRRKTRHGKTESLALLQLLTAWDMVDTLFTTKDYPDNALDIRDFQSQNMTFHRNDAASRIDRIYIQADYQHWIASHEVSAPGNHSDHKQVHITFRDPNNLMQKKKVYSIYPAKLQDTKTLQDMIRLVILKYKTKFEKSALQPRDQSPDLQSRITATQLWEELLLEVKAVISNARRTERDKILNSKRTQRYRQLKYIKKQQHLRKSSNEKLQFSLQQDLKRQIVEVK